jgi:hypothetical protein
MAKFSPSKGTSFLFAISVVLTTCLATHNIEEVPSSTWLKFEDDSITEIPSGYLLNSSSSPRKTLAPNNLDQLPLQNYARLAEIEVDGSKWTVHEDLSGRDGPIAFIHEDGRQKLFTKTAEAVYWKEHANYPKYLGLSMAEIGMSPRDILADALLKDGEPIEEKVAAIIPPLGSKNTTTPGGAPKWTSFVGNVLANDNVPIFGYGNTRSYQPMQKFPFRPSAQRLEGYVGGWMPAVRKVHPISASEYVELVIFGDVDSQNPFIVPTWHRTTHIQNGNITRVQYGNSYPEFGPFRKDPSSERFYRALFRFGDYYNKQLEDFSPLKLPDQSWVDLTKFAFAKELLVRPGGVYPKYGAVDRDYFGMEYDGFQDIFTSSLAANLEWGRFKMAHDVIDNYFTLYTSTEGAPDMRGPEIAQFGMTLALLTKYARYTGDEALLRKHKTKILAIANGLIALHDESLKLPSDSPGYGLIHGWSESDACLKSNPEVYWKPYFANSAFTARGLKDIALLEMFASQASEWSNRSKQLIDRTVESMRASLLQDRDPPYMPPLPGTNKTFRESMATDKPSSQDWPHRLYAELLHAEVLPADITDQIHNTMRSYGATSLGVVANVGVPNPHGRDLLGFISYGYAHSLLLHDRANEFALFLYSHRYHVHSRGAWNAEEVAGINGDRGLFCIPAQLTIPAILRWALVLEHPDFDILMLGKGVPRAWLETGREISIQNAPTRWGRLDYSLKFDREKGIIRATVSFRKDIVPEWVEVKLRAPKGLRVSEVSFNGKPIPFERNEGAIIRLTTGMSKVIVEAKVKQFPPDIVSYNKTE